MKYSVAAAVVRDVLPPLAESGVFALVPQAQSDALFTGEYLGGDDDGWAGGRWRRCPCGGFFGYVVLLATLVNINKTRRKKNTQRRVGQGE